MSTSASDNFGCITLAAAGLFLSCIPIGCVVSLATERTVTATVNKAEAVGGQSPSYRIYTNQGQFTVDDSTPHLHFRSADVYAQIKEGSTYNMQTHWFRFGPTNSFPNVLSVQELDTVPSSQVLGASGTITVEQLDAMLRNNEEQRNLLLQMKGNLEARKRAPDIAAK